METVCPGGGQTLPWNGRRQQADDASAVRQARAEVPQVPAAHPGNAVFALVGDQVTRPK